MKKIILATVVLFTSNFIHAQKASELFTSNTLKVSWLGIDFSHTKLIGSFEQLQGVLEQSPLDVRNEFFPAWNRLIINEAQKYDVNAMMRRDNMRYEIDMIMRLNALAPIGEMEQYNAPDYTIDDIKKFVDAYNFEGKTGVGIVFINECLNKAREEAIFHVAAINLSTKEILFCERIKGKPQGFGLRNYWAGAIYNVIKQIRNNYYGEWKARYGKM